MIRPLNDSGSVTVGASFLRHHRQSRLYNVATYNPRGTSCEDHLLHALSRSAGGIFISGKSRYALPEPIVR